MRFISTRGNAFTENASQAIAKGLAEDGGLFVPQSFPDLSQKLDVIAEMTYPERAALIIGSFLDEYDGKELLDACKKAYSKFEDGDPAPVVKIDEGLFVTELFHGPTLAFKDVALTLLPYLLRKGADNCNIDKDILILVATSGDTGKAALEGFKDQKGIKINVFYPSDGVSDMQKLQMKTQEGDNVNVVGVKGNFDDCQTSVKNIFSDKAVNEKFAENGVVLSSANSINFGRLVPQIVYYFSAYSDLVNSGEIKLGDSVNFTVPTGNFGNILAGYYAKKMGLPVNKLVCASNSNNVLTEFILTGTYNANREFLKTMSPSMDILVSSNLERLIFELSDRDVKLTADRMSDLKKRGEYSISDRELDELENDFFADFCDEQDCSATISDFFEEYGYLADPHTAVALYAQRTYREAFEDDRPMIVLSTASPYKFPQSVLNAITGKTVKDAFKASKDLETESAYPVPEQITTLKDKTVRFDKLIERDETLKAVTEFLGIK